MRSSGHIKQRRRPRSNYFGRLGPFRRLGRFRAAIAAAAMAVAAIVTTPASAKPERIVSMNVCMDQLVMLLADRDRIASLSFLATDPRASVLASEAVGIRVNHGLSEEILPMNPDLVLASIYTTRSTVFLLRKLGYSVVELPVASNLDDIRSNIRAVAEAVGEPARGEAVIAAFDGKLPPEQAPQAGPRPLAVLYMANGYTSGKGTLENAAAEAAGFRTLGNELGLTGISQLSLETLIASDPDVLVIGWEGDAPSLANETFRHPALRQAFINRPKVRVPNHLWVCGTPFIANAIEQLVDTRRALQQTRQHRIERQ